MRLFTGIDESRTEVRAALKAEIGLDHTASNAERRYTALVLSAWETARTQQRSNDESRAEARTAMIPRPVPINEHAMLREALEAHIGRLKDYEVPSKNLVASKMDDIETNMPRVEDLRDVSSMEDGEVDLLQGNLDVATGTFKMKAARNTVQMPKTPEELRLRHRRLGVAWEMARTKHRNRVWLETLPLGESISLRYIVRSVRRPSLRRNVFPPDYHPAAKNDKGKGRGGGIRPTKKLFVKTPDGRPLCFKYNNNAKCAAKNCNFVHQCQRCLGNHPKSSCRSGGNDTSKAATPNAGAGD